jgi:RNA polymerase sigma-70 factor (ECF subfamily)
MDLELDRQLLEGYRRGDRRVLDRLYRHFSGEVLASLSRGFRAAGAAGPVQVGPLDLDAAHQETFVRAFGASARLHYDGLQPFRPYLLAIARSAAVDVLRAQGKLHRGARALDDLEAHEVPVDPAESPEALALRAEAEAAVQSFLATLGAADLAFATARFLEGLSQEKAGSRCGLSRQEARTREARLKAACLAHLARRGFLDSGLGPAHRLTVAALVLQLLLPG